MPFLNYHHLRYFRSVANAGNLTKAAGLLKVSQSALSVQLRQLEESLGHALFLREKGRLKLTEAGRLVLDYAESIFRTGEEMMTMLERRSPVRRKILAVGAVATMSRNFQIELLKPFLNRPDVELLIRSGSLRELLVQLEAHTIDVVLSTLPVRRDAENGWHCHLLAEEPVSLVSRRTKGKCKFRFPEDLRHTPVILPSLETSVRAAFDIIMEKAGVRPTVVAEVDDMAMLRLLARESNALTLVPPVVVQDELRSGLLIERCRLPQIKKSFYAITPRRVFPNEIVQKLIQQKK